MKINFFNYSISLTIRKTKKARRPKLKYLNTLAILSYFLIISVLAFSITLVGAKPPDITDNICTIFEEKRGWYSLAKRSSEAWGISIPIMMAIVHQESRFYGKAKPPRRKIWRILPGPRISSSYGYSQAKASTWDWYQQSTQRKDAERDDFADAIDFVGWYNSISHKLNQISRQDSYNLYLAYHEGHGGYKKSSFMKKPWLIKVAKQVERLAGRYESQLSACEEDLQKPWYWPF